MARRIPPKVRGKRQVIVHRHEQATTDTPEAATYAAPSHVAGQFEQHEHGSGHGAFGFTEHTLP